MWIWIAMTGVALSAGVSSKRPTDMERGKELYERHCVACHGSQARGDGPATAALVHPVPDLAGRIKADPDRIDIVVFGAGTMPAFEASFDRSDAKRVLQYMAVAHDKGRPTPVPDEAERDDSDEDDDEVDLDGQTPDGPEGPR